MKSKLLIPRRSIILAAPALLLSRGSPAWAQSQLPLPRAGNSGTSITSTITLGSQLTLAMTGPWALQGVTQGSETFARVMSGSYNNYSDTSWRPTDTYVYNNSPSNAGGIVPAGGMTIDGYAVPAKTVVLQFCDCSNWGGLYFDADDGTSVMFRGCRFRPTGGYSAPGFLNVHAFTHNIYAFFCDVGSAAPYTSTTNYLQVGFQIQNGIFTAYRNYISYVVTGMQPNSDHSECTENYICQVTLYNPGEHLNGISYAGGETCILCLRNNITLPRVDVLGNTIAQTDCIALFQDFGNYPGTGTNRDGSVGYKVDSNYVGGGGYCFYGTQGSGSSANAVFSNNQVTTTIWPKGGYYGPAAHLLSGRNGNLSTNNTWYDGRNAGRIAF